MTHYLRDNIRVSVIVDAGPLFQLECRTLIRIGPFGFRYWAMLREMEAMPYRNESLSRTLASVGQYMLGEELRSDNRRRLRLLRQEIIRKRRQRRPWLQQVLKRLLTLPSTFIINQS